MGGGELASETIISYFRRGVIPVLPDPMVLLFRDCMMNKLVGIICFFCRQHRGFTSYHISSYTLLLKHSISSKKVGLHTHTITYNILLLEHRKQKYIT